MLDEYARKNRFLNARHFIDDGWSGTRWDRPSFVELVDLVNNEKVVTIIKKRQIPKECTTAQISLHHRTYFLIPVIACNYRL